jgi:hypothetical protein
MGFLVPFQSLLIQFEFQKTHLEYVVSQIQECKDSAIWRVSILFAPVRIARLRAIDKSLFVLSCLEFIEGELHKRDEPPNHDQLDREYWVLSFR